MASLLLSCPNPLALSSPASSTPPLPCPLLTFATLVLHGIRRWLFLREDLPVRRTQLAQRPGDLMGQWECVVCAFVR